MVGMSVQGMTGFLTASGDPGRTAGQHVVKSGRTKTRGCIRGGEEETQRRETASRELT